MTENDIRAITAALEQGYRVELTKEADGSITIRTVTRKKVKVQ
jgi:hypothetical protein